MTPSLSVSLDEYSTWMMQRHKKALPAMQPHGRKQEEEYTVCEEKEKADKVFFDAGIVAVYTVASNALR